MSEGLGRNFAAPVGGPLFAVTYVDIADARVLEECRQVLDAGISARQCPAGDGMLCRLIPVLGDLFKIQVGIVADSERADFRLEIAQAPLGQLAILCP